MVRYSLLFLLLSFFANVSAQNRIKSIAKNIATKIDSMSVKGLDSNFVEAPKQPWQIIMRGNVNQSTLSMTAKGRVENITYSARPYMKTEPSQYVGIWAGYRGYGLGYTVNIAGDKGSYLTFGSTGSAYGINIRIHKYENNRPHFEMKTYLNASSGTLGGNQIDLNDPIKVHTLIADGYYMFNDKRFSYAAAYDQSVIQRRSAGSIMAGAMYCYGNIDYAKLSNATIIAIMQGLGRIRMWQGSVGIGYAYNWVPTRGLLISAMAMPMLTVVNKIKAYGYKTNADELMNDPRAKEFGEDFEAYDKWWFDNLRLITNGAKLFNSGMTLNFDARLSVTYNFSRWFINAYGQFNNMRYRHVSSHGHLNDWYINTSLGIRL